MANQPGRPGRVVRSRLAPALAILALAGLVQGVPGSAAAPVAPRPGPAASPAPASDPGAHDRSGGCGQKAPAAAPAALEVEGRLRPLITVVPAGYLPDHPHPLVIAFHGRTTSSAKARRYYGLEPRAAGPTILVYPSALRRGDGTYSWADPGDPTEGSPDLALFDALVARISSLYCIDLGRVFAVGHSLGAWYANSLGCARGDVLRAIGTVAGGITGATCRGGVAALLLHNPNDRQVGYRHGLAARDRLRAGNGLSQPTAAARRGGFACQRQGAADAPNPVLWCPYRSDRTRSGRYYPHHWPEGAAAAIIDFFASLPEPPETSAARPAAARPAAARPAAARPAAAGPRG